MILGSKYLKTKFPTVKKKEKWTKDSLIDGRNEPVQIVHVLEIIAAIRNENPETIAKTIYQNSIDLFFSSNKHLRKYFYRFFFYLCVIIRVKQRICFLDTKLKRKQK